MDRVENAELYSSLIGQSCLPNETCAVSSKHGLICTRKHALNTEFIGFILVEKYTVKMAYFHYLFVYKVIFYKSGLAMLLEITRGLCSVRTRGGNAIFREIF